MKDTITIAVYCSAVADLPEHWQRGARATGAWIGARRATLVYGGVDAGLMTTVARATHEAGGRVVAAGTPEEIGGDPNSITGRYLK